MSINNFFLTWSDLLKDIIVNINYINNPNGPWFIGDKDKKNLSAKIEEYNSLFMKENNINENKSNNPFIEVFKKLVEYQKNKEIDISYDYKLLFQYISELKNFAKKEKNISEKLDLVDLNQNLIDKFYKNDNLKNKKVDKIFVRRFLSKKPLILIIYIIILIIY